MTEPATLNELDRLRREAIVRHGDIPLLQRQRLTALKQDARAMDLRRALARHERKDAP